MVYLLHFCVIQGSPVSGVATVNHGNIRKIISVTDPAPAQRTPEQTQHAGAGDTQNYKLKF